MNVRPYGAVRSFALPHVRPARAFLTVALLAATVSLSACTAPASASEGAEGGAERSEAAAHKHEAAGQTCFICDASKRDAGRLWCKEHARYEDRCWLCHPELRDPKRAYCEEHHLYEDECFLCDPSRAETGRTEGAETDELFCNEHQVPENVCGICHPDLAGTLPVGESLLVRLASARSAELAGLSVARPSRADATTSLALLGEVRFDGNRMARVTPLAAGVLADIRVDVGRVVAAGDVLAVVNAPDVAEAKADYLSALADLELRRTALRRERHLFEEKIGARRTLDAAKASHRRAQVTRQLARQRLLNLGFTESEVDAVRESGSSSAALPLRAPFRGTVVRRSAVLGEAVGTGEALFEIADLDEMWVELAVPEEAAARVAVGTQVQVTVQTSANDPIEGRVSWVSPTIDERTRMVRARAVLPNDRRALRHGMFAELTATLGEHPDALLVPASAVLRLDGLPFVFVQEEADLYVARRVDVGDRTPSDQIVVHHGLAADDDVVTTGGFTIKSALLASRLGAGCTDD